MGVIEEEEMGEKMMVINEKTRREGREPGWRGYGMERIWDGEDMDGDGKGD